MNPTSVLSPNTGAAPAPADPSQFGQYSNWAKGELAKGFSADQLHQSLAQSGASIAPTAPATPATAPAHSGNWFTHLLPTIGSVAVPALGALLAPETGGLSLLAAAGLSGAGAGLGKSAENAVEGKGLGDDVASAGAEGLIGGAAGGVAGKALGKAAGALGNAGEKMATKQATNTAAQDAIDTAANTYKDIPPALQKAYNAKDSLAHVTNMGFDVSDPANLAHVSNTSNDILNATLDRALGNSGPVDLAHYPQIIKDALAKEGGTLGSYDPTALARGRLGPANTPAAKLLQQLEGLGAGVAKTNSDPNELRTLTTKLGQLAQDAKPTVTAATGAIDPQQRAAYGVINNVRDQVKNALYDRPEVSDALTGELGNITAKDVGSQQLADHLNSIITTAGKGDNSAAQDYLRNISQNINIGNLGQEGQKIGQIVTSTGGKARAAAEAGLDQPATGSDLGNAVANGGGLLGAMKGHPIAALGTAAVHTAQNPAILSTLSRIGAMGEKLAPAAGSVVATSPNLAADPVPVAGGAPGGTIEGTMGPATTAAPQNSVQSILDQYMRMGQADPYLLGDTTPLVQQLAPLAQKNAAATATLGSLPASFANAGGAQGTGGILSHISGLIPGTAANTYQNQSAAAANQLAQALGISPQAAAGLLPSLMQNGQSAGISQGVLGSLQGQLGV